MMMEREVKKESQKNVSKPFPVLTVGGDIYYCFALLSTDPF
uniref:Uncharacterized protein n=1 Tax=Tetranychus urticae TaxID=32264 RepID=T1JVI6_TETUR